MTKSDLLRLQVSASLLVLHFEKSFQMATINPVTALQENPLSPCPGAQESNNESEKLKWIEQIMSKLNYLHSCLYEYQLPSLSLMSPFPESSTSDQASQVQEIERLIEDQKKDLKTLEVLLSQLGFCPQALDQVVSQPPFNSMAFDPTSQSSTIATSSATRDNQSHLEYFLDTSSAATSGYQIVDTFNSTAFDPAFRHLAISSQGHYNGAEFIPEMYSPMVVSSFGASTFEESRHEYPVGGLEVRNYHEVQPLLLETTSNQLQREEEGEERTTS